MPDLFSHRKLPAGRWPTGSLMILAAFGLFAMGCDRGATADLEAKISELEGKVEAISELEGKVEAQERAIVALASAATLSRASVFDSPLKQFFDAPEFWEVIEVDQAACHNSCYRAYKAKLVACGDDEECQFNAAVETVECHDQCGF